MIIDSYELLFKNSPIEMVHKKNVIYKFEHLDDGKIYIGKTIRELRIKIDQHIKIKSKRSHIDNAIKKYGIEKFDIEVIAEADTEEELNALEKFFIEFYGCKAPNGYNLTDGGEGMSGYHHSQSSKEKISKTHKGKCWRKGYSMSEKTRINIRKSKIHSVKCVELNINFESMTDAAKWAGVGVNAISSVCNGKSLTAGGYHWISTDSRYPSNVKKPIPKKNIQPIRCVETNAVFNSISEAAKNIGVLPSSVNVVLNKENRTSGGYHWISLDKSNFHDSKKNLFHNTAEKQVCCIEKNLVFDSIKTAAKWAGVSHAMISKACRGERKTAAGYHWQYSDGKNIDIKKLKEKPTAKKVKCLEKNKIFNSVVDAAKWAGVSASAVGNACRGKYKTAGGYHWKFADEEN